MRQLYILALFILLNGCSTAVTIQDLDRPVHELQQMAERSSPGGLAKVSRNGREFQSNFFATKKGNWETYNGEKNRYFSLIKVLGDRRPYSLLIQVFEQTRTGENQFSRAGLSAPLSRVLQRRMEKALHESAKGRNVIDDFKVF